MSRLGVRLNGFVALLAAATLWGCGGEKPAPAVEEVTSALNASVPGRGSGLLWLFASGELRVWDMASSTSYKELSLGSMDPVWRVAGTGDFAAHGASDILWRNDRDKTVGLWF